jgi:hypothetical protein
MKQKKFHKKLVIKKVTVSNLTHEDQLSIRGGTEDTLQSPCEGTIQGRTCDYETQIAACQ